MTTGGAAFPSLADVVTEHSRCDEWGGPQWDCGAQECNACGNSYEDYAEHIQDEWLKARTVTTTEQLDQLPFLALIREVLRPAPSGRDYGGVYERRATSWWALAGVYREPSANGDPRLPVVVLWHPEHDKSAASADGT